MSQVGDGRGCGSITNRICRDPCLVTMEDDLVGVEILLVRIDGNNRAHEAVRL